MTANILPLAMFIFCIKQELVIMILILVPDKCIHKQMRRQISWLGALQNCTNHIFCKTNQNSNVQQQNIWQIMLCNCICLWMFLCNTFQSLNWQSLWCVLCWHWVLYPVTSTCLFADHGVGIGPCVSAHTISLESVLFFLTSPPVFPFMFLKFLPVSCHQRKIFKDNVTLSQWQTKEPPRYTVKPNVLGQKFPYFIDEEVFW